MDTDLLFSPVTTSREKPRQRHNPFTPEERSYLMQLVNKYKPHLECRKSDLFSVRTRKRCWEILTADFNSIKGHTKRTHQQLKKATENFKMRQQKLHKGKGNTKPPNHLLLADSPPSTPKYSSSRTPKIEGPGPGLPSLIMEVCSSQPPLDGDPLKPEEDTHNGDGDDLMSLPSPSHKREPKIKSDNNSASSPECGNRSAEISRIPALPVALNDQPGCSRPGLSREDVIQSQLTTRKLRSADLEVRTREVALHLEVQKKAHHEKVADLELKAKETALQTELLKKAYWEKMLEGSSGNFIE